LNRPSQYSLHQPGVGVLVAPGWAIARRRGAQFIVAIVAVLLMREMVLAGEVLGASRRTAIIASALVFFSPAVFLIARTAFSELPVAFLLMHVFRRGLTAERTGTMRRGEIATAALAVAAVPWFHVRMSVAAALLAVGLFFTCRGARRAAPLVALACSSALLLLTFHSWFGSWSPSAPYLHSVGSFDGPSWRAVLGLLVDGHTGIVFAAPLAVVALVAAAAAWRRAPRIVLAAGLGVVASSAIAASWSLWWLGTSTPGRFWAPLVPMAAPLIALLWPRWSSAVKTGVCGATIVIAGILVACPWGAYANGPHGETRVWHLLGIGGAMPSLIDGEGRSPLMLAVAVVLAVALALVVATDWFERAETAPGDPQHVSADGGALT
jgi:hypothetical protein